jgi:hypothetical protein
MTRAQKLYCLATLSATLVSTAQAVTPDNALLDFAYGAGIQAVDIIKMTLGVATVLGALGFFITTSARYAHCPVSIRRTFFGIFVFSNIISQIFFNIANVPNNKKLICMLGTCITKPQQ